jgi:hypothetical protein
VTDDVAQLTHAQYDALERAIVDGRRIAVYRRGTEYVVVAVRIMSSGTSEALLGKLPMTGEELTFRLDEIDSFQVIE